MKEEALDFLRFLTSYRVTNSLCSVPVGFPATIGVEPTEEMRPFTPNPEGIINTMRLNFTGGNVATVYRGQLYLFIGGDITYDEFVEQCGDGHG